MKYVSLNEANFDIDWHSAFEPCFNDIDAMWNVFKIYLLVEYTSLSLPIKANCPTNKNGVNH